MVDHAEGACEVLSQTASPAAMPWASSDQVQGIHTAVVESTLGIAPCTPMQLSVSWQKRQTHETPPASSHSLPSLSLGRGSSERQKGGMVMPNSQQSPLQQQMTSRCGQAGASTPSKDYSRIQLEVQRGGPELHKENLLSLSLSKHENRYRSGKNPDPAIPLGHYTGHPPLNRVPAMLGLSKVLPAEMLTSPQGHIIQSPQHKEALYAGFTVLPDKSPLLSPIIAEKASSIPALSGSCESGPNDSRLTSELGSSTLYSPVPGEEANNAYKLYSEMFPPTCTVMSVCTTSSSLHAEQVLCLPNPILAEHVDVMQLLPVALYQQQLIASGKGDHADDRPDSGKRLKYTPVKEEDTSSSLLDVKKEQDSEQQTASCCGLDATNTRAARNSPSRMDTSDMYSLNSTWKQCMELGCETSHKDCIALKPSPEQPQSRSTILCSPKPSKANSISHTPKVTGGYSACVASGTAEMGNAQPAVGLKLFTTSANAQMPKALLTFSAGEPSLPLSLEPSHKLPNIGVGKNLAHGSSSTDADWGKFLALSATPVGNTAETASASMLPFQQRFKQLQAFLKQCDEADQNECMQVLRSLSAAARSGQAVELETRAIRLSLEEGKEMKRMRVLNVLGRIPERSLDDAGATPHGPRLPAPGATSKLKHVL